jgi:outer membrane protein OmpA-like peptidoglycan-associated protein
MLTYEWSTTAGTIEGSGPAVQLRTANLQPGGYTATVRATEAPGLFADCTTRVTVRTPPPPPPQPPTVTCSVDRPSVQRGEVVTLTATARSPQNRPLTYQWTPSAGQVQGTGATVRFDTTNLQPGTYTVRVRVTDDANQSAECSMMVTVTAPPPPPPPPQASKLDECLFNLNSGRVDNVCKAKLDNVALRLQSEADATLVIVGLAESTERNAQRLAQTRADNTKAYLTREKGIADSRVSTRTGSTAARGREQRKTELHLVPRGATFTGQNVIPEVRPANENAAIRQAPSGTQPSVTRTTTPSRSPYKPGTTARNSGVAPKDNRYPGRAVLARAR